MSHPTHPAGGHSAPPLPVGAPFSIAFPESVTRPSCCCQKDGAMIAANDAEPTVGKFGMNVVAKREDVFTKPVLIGVRGWYFQPLKQVKSGYKAVRATCLMPRPANER